MVSNLMTNKQIPFEKMEPPFCFGMTKPYNHYGATIIIMEWSDHNGLGNRPLVRACLRSNMVAPYPLAPYDHMKAPYALVTKNRMVSPYDFD
jgi:hypothetical protein